MTKNAELEWMPVRNVPEWLLLQYQSYKEEVSERDWFEYDDIPMSLDERIAFFDRIVFNMEGKEFWSAIDKRRHELEEFWKKELEIPQESEINQVGHLLEMALMSVRGQSRLEKMVASERAKVGRRISKSCAGALKDLLSLKDMIGQEHGIPRELSFALSDASINSIEKIKADADSWACSHPMVRRPNIDGADVRYFVRAVADYFGSFYDQKLYAATASLSRCVYGSDVTEERVREILRTD